jgi:hypothetical protein
METRQAVLACADEMAGMIGHQLIRVDEPQPLRLGGGHLLGGCLA